MKILIATLAAAMLVVGYTAVDQASTSSLALAALAPSDLETLVGDYEQAEPEPVPSCGIHGGIMSTDCEREGIDHCTDSDCSGPGGWMDPCDPEPAPVYSNNGESMATWVTDCDGSSAWGRCKLVDGICTKGPAAGEMGCGSKLFLNDC